MTSVGAPPLGPVGGFRGRMPNPPRVVVADDDPEMRRLLVSVLERDGYDVISAIDGRALLLHVVAAEDQAHEPEIDLIVSDMRMPVTSGLEILRALRAAGRKTPFVLLSAFGDDSTRALAESLGAFFLSKPFDLRDLREIVRASLTP